MKKEQRDNEEIAKIIERDQVISYKKKTNTRLQKESDDEIESANSLKSGVFSEDSVNNLLFSKPGLVRRALHYLNEAKISKDLAYLRKRIFHIHRSIPQNDSKQVNNYLSKEVRLHDNLVLKRNDILNSEKNNHLSSENMKLKTKIMALEKEVAKISKTIEDDGQKIKQPGLIPRDNRFKGNESLSFKMAIKNLRKELDEQKKENEKIKWSIKFTRISELEIEREEILNETTRLRLLLEEEQFKKATHKAYLFFYESKEQGHNATEQKFQNLTEKNLILAKENSELHRKIKDIDETSKKFKQSSDNEKNLSKMLFNAKRTIKEKEKEIEGLKFKASTEVKIGTSGSIPMNPRSEKDMGRQIELNKSREKRVLSKSAQKYRKKVSEDGSEANDCENCQKLKEKNMALEKKIEELAELLKIEKEGNSKFANMGDFSRENIEPTSNEESEKISRFLTLRFKAHHLNFDEAQKYLINGEITEETKKEAISVSEMAESLVAEPFSVLSSRYLEICLLQLLYKDESEKALKSKNKIKIDESKTVLKEEVLKNFSSMIKPYEVMPQEKEEEMFIQIAELVTNYHQHILTALNKKRNGEGTICEEELIIFFNEIELEKEFVDFIICQIILESLDLEHLNFYTMFEIFYMPSQGEPIVEPNQPNKKKFQVDTNQIVKEEDEEYEESKSHIDVKQKTQSRRDEELLDEEEEYSPHSPSQHSEHQKHDDSVENLQANKKRNHSMKKVETKIEKIERARKKSEPKDQEEEEYEQLFEEEKMDRLPEEEKEREENEGDEEELKPYVVEEAFDEYKDEFES